MQNTINKLKEKLSLINETNDEFSYVLKEIQDILLCISNTDKELPQETILNAIFATSKILELKIDDFKEKSK